MYRKNCYVGMLLRSIIDQNFTYYAHRFFFTEYGGEGLWSWARTCDIWALYDAYKDNGSSIADAAEDELQRIYKYTNNGAEGLSSTALSYVNDLIALHRATNKFTYWATEWQEIDEEEHLTIMDY